LELIIIFKLVNLRIDHGHIKDSFLLNNKITNFDLFIKSASEFFPKIRDAVHVGSMFTTRVVLPNVEKALSVFLKNDLSKYHNELISNNDYKKLENALIETKTYLGEFGITEARLLYVFCRHLKPKIIIETGVASGLSSFMLLSAIEKNNVGKLVSIDLPPSKELNKKIGQRALIPQNKNVGWLIPEKLKKNWDLKLGDSKIILPKILKEVEKCDLFLHDSDHSFEHMIWEFETVWPYLRMALLSDDVNQNKAFENFASSHKCNMQIFERLGMILKKN